MTVSLKKFFIDTSRARDYWPKQISNLGELPVYYHTYLQEWLRKGLPLSHIIFVKQANKWDEEKPEYTLAWFNDCVILLRKMPDRQISQTVISATELISLEYNHIYLDCNIVITFKKNSDFKKTNFHFNYVTEQLFVPVLNVLLVNQPDYLYDVYSHDNSELEKLNGKSFLMQNVGKLAYRFYNKIETLYWDKNETEAQRKQNRKTKKSKSETEYLIALMQKGISTIINSENQNRAVYLFWNDIKDINLILNKNSEYEIKTITSSGDCFSIPVHRENSVDAQNFVNQCNSVRNAHLCS